MSTLLILSLFGSAGCEDEPEEVGGFAGAGGRGGAGGIGGTGGAGAGGAPMAVTVVVTRTVMDATAPVTMSSDVPGAEFEVTFPPADLSEMIAATSGAPIEIKLTRLAHSDVGMLTTEERALLAQGNDSLAIMIVDVARVGGGSADSGVSKPVGRPQSVTATRFKIKNQSGRRCTPGVVDFFQIFGTNSTRRASTITIDDEFPIQNIEGESEDVAYEVLHFIFCWECPRVRPSGSPGGG